MSIISKWWGDSTFYLFLTYDGIILKTWEQRPILIFFFLLKYTESVIFSI